MLHAKQASKPKSRTKALTVVTVAGTLSLAAGASVTAVSPAGHMARANRASAITLGEQQITELRVATFYVFDNENTGRHGFQFVKEHRHRGTGGSARAVYGGGAIYYRGGGGYGGYGGGGGPTGAGGPDGL
jgi:hypothetical protein